MIELKNELFQIELIEESTFTLDSTDNKPYSKLFNPINFKKGDNYSAVRFTMYDEVNDDTFKSYILITPFYFCESALLKENNLIVFLNNYIVEIDLTVLEVINCKQFSDYGVFFSIHYFSGGYLIYGELEIIKLDNEFNKEWVFGYCDIFISATGEESFQIKDEKIYLVCWNGNKLILDRDGNLIQQLSSSIN